jgi:hypothetical protein
MREILHHRDTEITEEHGDFLSQKNVSVPLCDLCASVVNVSLGKDA